MIKTEKYTITKERLPVHELIGLNVNVIVSTDSNKKGISGKIIDESQRMFTIETRNGTKMVPKHESVFAFELGSETIEINGDELRQNPIERLKNGGTILYA